MRILASAFLFLACGVPHPQCVSPCGAELFFLNDCEGFDQAEARALAAFQPVYGNGCDALNHVQFDAITTDGGRFTDQWNREVAGYDLADQRRIELAWDLAQPNWQTTAYAHEVAHQLDWAVDDLIDYDHATWESRGVWDAISRANQPEICADGGE